MEELEPRLTPAEVGLNDFRLSHMGPDGNPSFGAFEAAVAYNSRNQEYLVVWTGDDVTNNEQEVYGQRLDAATGALIGGQIRLSDMGPDGTNAFVAFSAAVAYNPTNNEYLVVWWGDDNTGGLVDNELEIFGQRINADPAAFGEVGANDFRISSMGPDRDTNYPAFDPAVAYNGAANEYLVVWRGVIATEPLVGNEQEVFGQRLNAATGAEVGTDFRISDMGPDGNFNFDGLTPAVAYNGDANEYLVVWYGDDNTGSLVDNEFEIFGQRINADPAAFGEVGVNDFRISNMGPDGDPNFGAFDPAVAYNPVNKEYLVLWDGDDNTGALVDEESEIFGQRLDGATGAEVGANDFRISHMGPDGNASFDAFDPAVAYNGAANEYLIAWDGDDNTAPLVDQEFENFGQRLDAATAAPIGLSTFRLSDMGPDGDPRFSASGPAVAYSGARNEYLIVWHGDDNTGTLVDGEYEIFGQRVSPLDPPPPPPEPPPPQPEPPPPQPKPPQIAVVAFRQKGRAKVRVTDAATGTPRAVLTPFRGYRGRLRLQLEDVTGDGSLDLVVRALVHGRRKQKVYDAVTLAPLPLDLA